MRRACPYAAYPDRVEALALVDSEAAATDVAAQGYSFPSMHSGAVIAIPFERKYVDYQDTRNIWAMILRSVRAFAIYFGLNTLLKMPFSDEFLDSASLSAFLVRTGRYTINMFVIMGLYPKIFPLFEKIGKSSGKASTP